MANEVYANNMEVSCKAAAGKSIACFPDVCFTPPQAPPTPTGVPIPYPNTGMAKDTTRGTRTVKITRKEVMLKDKSYFKTSYGDEAGCAPKKGIITSKIKGKVYFTSWSMDVKFEGENVVRNMDMTTHNHGSNSNTAPWLYQDATAFGDPPNCKKDTEKMQTACKDSKSKQVGERKHHVDCSDDCKTAMRCILVPKGKDKEMCCSPENTGDHLIEDHWVRPGGVLMPNFSHISSKPGGAYNGAPTMCANRSRYEGKHGVAHGTRGVIEETLIGKELTYAKAKEIALQSHKDANPDSECSPSCIESQLDHFYGKDPKKKCHSPTRRQPLKAEQRSDALKRISEDDDM
ncbi:GHH signature containing HNH/Endo VII superfamily nuclease toxin 2 [Pseudomonas sp. NFIX51]|uniref:DUF4150 domain-containing protein n=1 Tax=unclassified Pseudomonas TaxID=196821 RepID=UPI0008BC96DD|nr:MULTISPECIES: DUF4150 domain-containing protein [unclassified Pseudomonas]SEM16451.1 GHH signature containing HNH/Endo VII superfamily nuclease toxin 2 [Pseudomonas sp. NFACC41-3]SMH40879.1 GHH signature containing HNH/Endo VII superfamily nuclease toxin 2 [Pseudomonas sp. NFIX51]